MFAHTAQLETSWRRLIFKEKSCLSNCASDTFTWTVAPQGHYLGINNKLVPGLCFYHIVLDSLGPLSFCHQMEMWIVEHIIFSRSAFWKPHRRPSSWRRHHIENEIPMKIISKLGGLSQDPQSAVSVSGASQANTFRSSIDPLLPIWCIINVEVRVVTLSGFLLCNCWLSQRQCKVLAQLEAVAPNLEGRGDICI